MYISSDTSVVFTQYISPRLLLISRKSPRPQLLLNYERNVNFFMVRENQFIIIITNLKGGCALTATSVTTIYHSLSILPKSDNCWK